MKTTSKFLFIILGLVFLAAIRVRAQSFIWADQITSAAKTVGNKLATDSAGNVYMTGGFSGEIGFGITNLTAIGGQDIFLAKYASNGALLWVKQAGGVGAIDVANNICVDSNNNVYITGGFQDSTAFDTVALTAAQGVNNFFWAEYSPDGAVVRAVPYPDAGNGAAYAIAVDANDSVYIAGTGSKLTVAKWNSSGQLAWATEPNGNPAPSGPRCLVLDSANYIYLAGTLNANPTAGPTTLAKLDPNGNYVWAVLLPSDVQSLALAPDGNLVIAGTFANSVMFGTNNLSVPYIDGYVAELDTNGNVFDAWQMQNNNNNGNCATVDSDGFIYLTGTIDMTQTFIDKYDEQGNLVWSLQPPSGIFHTSAGLTLALGPSNRICMLSTATGAITFDNAVFTNTANNDLYLSVEEEDAPPAFATQPSPPLGLLPGSNGLMSASARSLFPVSFQWQFDGTNIAGATNNSLNLTNAQLSDEGPYQVIASNLYGANTSAVVNVSIYYSVTIISNGGPYKVTPFGYNIPNGLLTYSNHSVIQVTPQLFLSNFTGPFVNWTGDFVSPSNTLTLTVTSNIYLVANFADAVTNITIDNLDRRASFQGSWSLVTLPPYYFENSAQVSCSTNATASATFTPDIVVPGFYDVSCWFSESYVAYNPNGGGSSVSTNVPWTIVGDQGSITVYENARNFAGLHTLATGVHFAAGANGYISVSNGTGEPSSNYVPVDAVTLTPSQVGVATIRPANSTVSAGSYVSFNTTLSGTSPVSYQWQLNGVHILGATQSYLQIYPAVLTNAGSYAVAVSNVVGIHVSQPAVLTVTSPPPPSLDSISLDSSNDLQLSISANAGLTLAIQTSSNLTDWVTVTNIFNLNGSVTFTDTNSPGIQSRFYRAVWMTQ
ncbi:MAG TPA: SBBP repeat-containing protein [Candidatus Saccharimonadales bacterium]|nr:SBBP repeat-containing protein [Candidatus Saccharimonadales bacterium]